MPRGGVRETPKGASRPVVAILALGGTIAMTRGERAGVIPTLTGEMLAAAVPELGAVAKIEAGSFRQVPGAHLTFADIEALATEIEARFAAGTTGVVVTQGTDTIEETAFALDRLLAPAGALVVTGAMRNPTLPGADGPANLLAAVRVAVNPDVRGLGALVVLNDQIHAARFVRKTHTMSPAAFASPVSGPIGWVAESRVRIVTRPPQVAPVPLRGRRDVAVGLVTLALGDDGRMVEAAVSAGFSGLVIAAMGGGHANVPALKAIERAAGAMPVVLTSRTGSGEVLQATYGFAGSETDLLRAGAIGAGWLDPLKARVLLALGLRRGVGRDDLPGLFAPWGDAAGGSIG